MKRKIYDELLAWKKNDNGSTAVLIEGARRIGKSYIAEEFGRNEYDSYLLIDFSSAPPEVSELFDNYLYNIDVLLSRLQLFYNVSLTPRRSLIIFDEIQFCPRARSAIKQLVADGRFDYIETGSLISIKRNVKDILIPSEEHTIEMFPMDFEEFLWAMDNEMLMPYIRQQFESRKPMGDALHRTAMDYFRQYMIVGGMPQAVAKYVENKDFAEVDRIKRRIIELYRNDIGKYADGEETRVTSIFDEIPGQLQRHEKKFRLSALSEHARMRDYTDAFFWLSDAKIVNCCFNSTAPNIGLRLNEDRTTLKCYMGDTGLLISMAFDEHGSEIMNLYKTLIFGKLEVNEGMLVENIVAQMLRAAGHKLYFFSQYDNKNSENRMEIDFLIAKSRLTSCHNISPIEVKLSGNYTLSSLKKCIGKYGRYLSTPYVLHDKDLKEDEGIMYLPLYMA
ncbi:MAG: ATP-binding protein, partial [Muribaculaceae bacterium]|nr:ATP-binding protein [Muribaculaceae bacterium]